METYAKNEQKKKKSTTVFILATITARIKKEPTSFFILHILNQ